MTNPITLVILLFVGIWILIGKFWMVTLLGNLWYVWFGIKNETHKELGVLIGFAEIVQDGHGSKWRKYVFRLGMKKAKRLQAGHLGKD